jgi:hypothetical protein
MTLNKILVVDGIVFVSRTDINSDVAEGEHVDLIPKFSGKAKKG